MKKNVKKSRIPKNLAKISKIHLKKKKSPKNKNKMQPELSSPPRFRIQRG